MLTVASGAVACVTAMAAVRATDPAALFAVNVYVVETDGATTTLVRSETSPTPWSIDNEVAPVVVHESVADRPAWIDTGVAAKAEMTGFCGAPTVTVAVRCTLPAALLALSTKVVVTEGATVVLDPVTAPTPLSMVSAVAPDTLHDSVARWPLWMAAGAAAKESIVGTAPAMGVRGPAQPPSSTTQAAYLNSFILWSTPRK